MNQLISAGKQILIKPNLAVAKTNDNSTPTNSQLIESLIQEVLKTNPTKVALGESSTAGEDTMKAFQVTGMYKIAQRYGIKVIDFKKVPQVVKKVPRGREVNYIKVAQPIFEYDYLINVPVLKIH